jgi:molybdopterin-guanine dinucleotide biosynthesis protein
MFKNVDILIKKVQAKNFKTFKAWLAKNSKTLAPKTNLGVIYSGIKIVGKLRPSGILINGSMKADPQPMREMWKFIKAWNQMHKEVCGTLRYETLEDVLKRLPAPHDIKWTQGEAFGVIKIMANMFDCANDLCSDTERMLSKSQRKKVWPALSKVYASNIKGKLSILEGVLKEFKRLDEDQVMIEEFKRLDEDQVMISTEIPELLENDDLDTNSKKELKKLAISYNLLKTKQKDLDSEIKQVEKGLKKQI